MSHINTGNSSTVLGAASPHILAPLPYAENALEPIITAKTLSFHYGKHHKGYVENLNKLIAKTEYADLLPIQRTQAVWLTCAHRWIYRRVCADLFVERQFDTPADRLNRRNPWMWLGSLRCTMMYSANRSSGFPRTGNILTRCS